MRSLNRRSAPRSIRQPGTAVAFVVAAALIALALVIAALATAPAAHALSYALSRDHGASFAVRCDFSHRLSDDPIVHPGEPGKSHSHDFFGNTSTNANSTRHNLLTNSKTPRTTCTRPNDTAAYWIPTVYWDREELTANRAIFYYRAGSKNHTTVKPFPAGLKVIANDEEHISWRCADKGKSSRRPPRRCGSGKLGVRIIFPDCSNGHIDSANHRSHMAYHRPIDGKVRCPRSHPKPVPVLTMNVTFPIPAGESGRVKLACSEPSPCNASTMHADFFNAWNQERLKSLVKHCINDVPPSKPRPKECRASPA